MLGGIFVDNRCEIKEKIKTISMVYIQFINS